MAKIAGFMCCAHCFEPRGRYVCREFPHYAECPEVDCSRGYTRVEVVCEGGAPYVLPDHNDDPNAASTA